MKRKMKTSGKIVIAVFILIVISIGVLLYFKLFNKNYYKVTFNNGYGSNINIVEVTPNDAVSKPKSPTRDGYIFSGWYLGGVEYDFNSEVSKDIMIIAKWEKDTENSSELSSSIKYTVKFDSNGGTSVDSVTVGEEDVLDEPQEPTRNGYNFKYWAIGGDEFDFSSTINKNITLVAVWESKSGVIEPTSISFSKTTYSLMEGSSFTLNLTVNPNNATKKDIKWVSSDDEIVSVSSGKVTALKEGSATITASVGSIEAKCTINVSKTIKVESIELNTKNKNLTINEEFTLVATVKPDDAVNKTVTWTSSNPDVATVVNGKVVAIKLGNAVITAKSGDKTATCSVVVKDTYGYIWENANTENEDEAYLFIVNSSNTKVAGSIDISYSNGTTKTEQVPSKGLLLLKSEISSISNPTAN